LTEKRVAAPLRRNFHHVKQQSGLMLHRTRHLFMRQQISVINAIRAHLAEFGIVAPVECLRGVCTSVAARYGDCLADGGGGT
jgi:transposase